MLNVIVWGNQEQYDLFINQIKAEELKGNICVKGVVSEDCAWSNKIDEYEMIAKKVLLQELGGAVSFLYNERRDFINSSGCENY